MRLINLILNAVQWVISFAIAGLIIYSFIKLF
jgi:hypothetical protein